MPRFDYANEFGVQERSYGSWVDSPDYILIGGKRAYRQVGCAGGHLSSCWPQHSRTMGVHPSQIQEAAQHDRAMGVPADYDKRGNVIFRDRAHRKQWCKAHRVQDRDGGYGDAT